MNYHHQVKYHIKNKFKNTNNVGYSDSQRSSECGIFASPNPQESSSIRLEHSNWMQDNNKTSLTRFNLSPKPNTSKFSRERRWRK